MANSTLVSKVWSLHRSQGGSVANNHDGSSVQVVACGCGKGTMVRRRGKYGDFLGCSTFPMCRNTAKVAS